MNESANIDKGISNVEISNTNIDTNNTDEKLNLNKETVILEQIETKTMETKKDENVEIMDDKLEKEEKKDELSIEYPNHSHIYSYNIKNLSNNREDLGAGFRSRLKNLGSPTKSTYSSTSTSSFNPHPSYTENTKKTTTTSTTTSTNTSKPSSNTSSQNDIPNNNSNSNTSSSIPKSGPKPTPTSSTTDNKNSSNTASTSSQAAGKQKTDENEEEENKHMFECNICLDTASDPVVTMCGHLFCWPCLSKWMDGPMSAHNTCPVCKSIISRDTIVPLYGRGADSHKHPHPAAGAAASSG